MTPAQVLNPSRGPLHAVAALLVGCWGPPNSLLAPFHPADVAREAARARGLITHAEVI
jgi:hypothetical protein